MLLVFLLQQWFVVFIQSVLWQFVDRSAAGSIFLDKNIVDARMPYGIKKIYFFFHQLDFSW